MSLIGGTPQTLTEAIRQVLCTTVGPDAEREAHEIIRDFLAQKFGVAMLRNLYCEEVLKELFLECTKEEK